MKKITFVLSITFSLSMLSSTLKPLEEYISENNTKDSAVLEYIAKRCAASNLSMSNFIGKDNEAQKEGYDIAFNGYLFWFMRAQFARFEKRPNQDQDKAMKNVASSIVNMSNVISEILQNSQDVTGSVFEGNSFMNDLKICTELFNGLNKSEKVNE